MLYDFYNYERSPLPRARFDVIDGAEKKKTTQLSYSFSSIIDFRVSAVSIARPFPCRCPAVSLNTSRLARFPSISPAAVLPYLEYEQVSALPLDIAPLISLFCQEQRKRFPIPLLSWLSG